MIRKGILLIASLLLNFNVNAVNTEPILKSKTNIKPNKSIGVDFVGKNKAKTKNKHNHKKKVKNHKNQNPKGIITSPDPH